MNLKLKKFVFELSQNARIKTKEIGKKLKISQQSASYLLQSLQKKKTILGYSTIIDPAKFGLLQVLVYFNYADFDSKRIKEIISYLKENDYVVTIETLKQGYDLAVTFCVPNLSLYNKLVWDFLQKFKKSIILAEVYPIVVRHIYPKKYLSSHNKDAEIVISGDRDVYFMADSEKRFLAILYENPTENIVNIHKKTKMNPKTIVRIKNVLEENKVIKGYTTNFNLESLGIRCKHLLISSKDLSLEDDQKLLHFALTHLNIVSLTRLIGKYDFMIGIEEQNAKREVLRDLRTNFSIQQYQVIECKELVKDKYLPKIFFDS